MKNKVEYVDKQYKLLGQAAPLSYMLASRHYYGLMKIKVKTELFDMQETKRAHLRTSKMETQY